MRSSLDPPTETNQTPAISIPHAFAPSDPPANRMILVGAPDWIKTMIHRMHSARIAEVWAWSQLMPTGNQGEMISVLKRPRIENKL
jgi:hypothetical protein